MKEPDYSNQPLFARKLLEAFESILMYRVRRDVEKKERLRIPQLEQTISALKVECIRARKHGLLHNEKVLNVGLYVLLLDRDMAILKQDLIGAKDRWKKRFVARQMATLLYECCEDLPQMLGKDFRKTLEAVPTGLKFIRELNSVTKEIAKYKSQNEALLKKIRNFVLAHRDHDALQQLEVIESIDPLELFRIVADFFDSINRLVRLLVDLTLACGDTLFLMKQIAAKIDMNEETR